MKTTLDKVERGQKFIIDHLPNDEYKLQLIRFGIAEGEKLPASIKFSEEL